MQCSNRGGKGVLTGTPSLFYLSEKFARSILCRITGAKKIFLWSSLMGELENQGRA
jgi:hypothetical protein